jgi:hypothetical protein
MYIVSGLLWNLLGILFVGSGVLWLTVTDYIERVSLLRQLDEYLPLEVFGLFFYMLPATLQAEIQATQAILPEANLPFGNELTLLLGIFLIIMGTQIFARQPAWYLLSSYAHAIVGFILMALLYLLLVRVASYIPELIPIRPFWFYVVIGCIGALIIINFGLAYHQFQIGQDIHARRWKPFPQCEKCGRRLDENGLCPTHDIPQKQAWLVDNATGQKFRIPDKPAVLIGRRGNEDVRLTPDIRPEYANISRAHAQIAYDPGSDSFFITDLGSSHGTEVEQEVLPPHQRQQLTEAATIAFGGVFFRFVVEEVPHDAL